MKLLLVEDDADLGAALRDALAQDGHEVTWHRDGQAFEATLLAHRVDAVLLDLTLPDTDGERLLRELRRRRDSTPVIVISARGQRSDRIDLLDLGADDYLVKPVDVGELAARLRAVARRASPTAEHTVLEHGALRLDTGQGVVTWRGRRVPMRERERWVLEQFLRNPSQTLTRAQLEAALYGRAEGIDSNTIEVYVHHLRRWIAPELIVTVRGRGYRLGPAQALES